LSNKKKQIFIALLSKIAGSGIKISGFAWDFAKILPPHNQVAEVSAKCRPKPSLCKYRLKAMFLGKFEIPFWTVVTRLAS
jgi:hypothetical protein